MARISLVTATLFLLGAGTAAFAVEFPNLTLRLEMEKDSLIPGEPVIVTLEIINNGPSNLPRWDHIHPGAREEFRFTMLDSQGNRIKEELQYSRPAEQVLLNPVKPGERVEYHIPVTNFFFPDTLDGSFPKPGDYTLWVEYIPEINERPDAPVVAKSNILKFHVEPMNVAGEKIVNAKFLDLSTEPPTMHESRFSVFLHKGSASYRLYWTRTHYSPHKITDNVKPEMWDMKVDRYGDTHVWYQTTAGDFYCYIRRNSTIPPPENKHIPQHLKEDNWETLDVPPNHQPQFKVTEGKVTLEYVPVSQPPAGGENHQPPEGDEDHHNGAGQGVTGETPPAAQSFPIHLIIIAAVIIIGVLAAFLIIRSQKRHGT